MAQSGITDRPRESAHGSQRSSSADQERQAFRAGYVGVFGRTNVGKSTLLNAVMGRKLLISSSKPQATRNRVRCILSRDDAQIVFVDTPGLHRPKNKLGRQLVREAYRGLREIDVLLYVIEPWVRVQPFDLETLDRIQNKDLPIILLVNKIDMAKGNDLEETLLAYAKIDRFAELIPISATRGSGLDDVVQTTISYLPEHAAIFPENVTCDRPESFLIEEIIREQVFQMTFREVPYSSAVQLKWLREPTEGSLLEIKAEILVERESQKGIVIGKRGRLIKEIGIRSRAEIERLLGRSVFLELIVSVSSGWTHDDEEIRRVTEG